VVVDEQIDGPKPLGNVRDQVRRRANVLQIGTERCCVTADLRGQ